MSPLDDRQRKRSGGVRRGRGRRREKEEKKE